MFSSIERGFDSLGFGAVIAPLVSNILGSTRLGIRATEGMSIYDTDGDSVGGYDDDDTVGWLP